MPVPAPEALAVALSWSAHLLDGCRERAAATSPRHLLARLDEARRSAAREDGLDATAVIPFATRADSPTFAGLSAREIVEEACSPVHFAAFRLWGWIQVRGDEHG